MVERLISIPSPEPLIQAFQKVNLVGERPCFNPSRIRFLLLSYELEADILQLQLPALVGAAVSTACILGMQSA